MTVLEKTNVLQLSMYNSAWSKVSPGRRASAELSKEHLLPNTRLAEPTDGTAHCLYS